MVKKLIRYFVRGCLVLAPLAVTVYILVLVFTVVDRMLPVGIPGLGVLIAGVLIILVGFLTSNVVGRSVFELTERVFTRLPLVKLLYTSIKDLVGAFVGDRRRFDRPVAVTLFPESGAKVLGFVTRDQLQALGTPGHVAVYVPQSYNFAGNLLLVPSELVAPVPISSGDLMTFIVSGGVTGLGVGQSLPQAEPQLPP
jgi:uncharacterized membrane protein